MGPFQQRMHNPGNLCIAKANCVPQIKVPVVNKEATNTPTWTLPPIPPMDPYHSSAFFAEYNFEIKDSAWRSEISTLVYWYKEGALEVLCWMLYRAHDSSKNGHAGDIAEWAPAFKVGSTRQNVISVVNFLLTKFRAVHPHALEDEDTAIVIN
ncbi:hypothetical protein K504DRAFT_509009 [Pleomassaria siparia CBS 279.74]|uniref:Uncharacterized protein n=1 Tax=Pleomassaria siparia CBS 279.74 TaxID=1314801 RepID=A0A6G1JP77_9PLEO|nr:hypothetical protein K504DRAFT_509009 [Pleomassaria siparia CBS 279.74]